MNTINKLFLEDYLNVNSPVSILNMEFNECDQNQIVHTHNFYEFFVVTEGRILHKHNDHIYEMGPRSAFFIAADDYHVLNKSNDCIKASVINTAFSEDDLKEVVNFLSILEWDYLKTGHFIKSMKVESFEYIISKLSYIQQDHLLTYDKKQGVFRNLLSNLIIELFAAIKENNNEIPLWLFSCC
jgi:AraC family transcriptional regulator, dual regulator of chb operon